MDNHDRYHAVMCCAVERARLAYIKAKTASKKGAADPKRTARLESTETAAKEEWVAIAAAADAFADLLDEVEKLRASAAPVNAQEHGGNPFTAYTYQSDHGPVQTYHCDADGRLRVLASFDKAQCEAGLLVPGLQAVVRNALERRLRKLARDAAYG